MSHSELFARLGLSSSEPNQGVYTGKWTGSGSTIDVINPSDGSRLGQVIEASPEDVAAAITATKKAFLTWRKVATPKRGEILRQIRNAIAENLVDLGALVTLEMGKIATEGRGEVQEFIDVADYAVGLARSIGGTVIPSERDRHFITEVSNPLGVVGVITAFNFPIAVYGWNVSLALICGDTSIWKPAPTTPLCAIATTRIIAKVLEANGIPGAVSSLVCGGGQIGEAVATNNDVDLISFTGSEARGKQIGIEAAARFKQSLLELGGNNAAIVMPDANLRLAVQNIVFAALGTAGQRCTTTRRLFVHSSIASNFITSLVSAFQSASERIGRPEDPNTLIGPLHSRTSLTKYHQAIARIKQEGGEVRFGGESVTPSESLKDGNWVLPTIAVYSNLDNVKIIREETFAPILHVATFDSLDEAIALNNSVEQGLSSSLFTRDMSNVFKWIGPEGSDCGIVNVNGSTSGAEIGARFGGNKSTGWGRESGGDAWKQYCRWSSCTLNWSDELGLAQGVSFD